MMNDANYGAAIAPAEPTAFNEAESAFEAARELSNRVLDMVSTIAGSVPEPGEKESSLSSLPNGRLESIRDGAYKAKAAMRRAQEALNRLERAI